MGVHWGIATLVAVPWLVACWRIYRFGNRLQRNDGARPAVQENERFRQLSLIAEKSDFELEITTSSRNTYFAYAAFIIGIALFFMDHAELNIPTYCVLTLPPIAGALLLEMAPIVRKPVITLRRCGFEMPSSPYIPWRCVEDMFYVDSTREKKSGSVVIHMNISSISLPNSPGWLTNSLGQDGVLLPESSDMVIYLDQTNESPSIVARLAEFLWTQSA